ncbi:FAD/FMN-containing dehydrogenase [Sphaerotilus hippei]|uniref:FAD/FMN-containing dehydrogenase n=1 Tax=Sphaerotilus hippei TaxID=744406 RepID=A0A318H2R4_9BURK|nr:FAD-binding oxidoreductase [Sphaerotilus hippei]PXW92336.1 FAD/FMN-containing dehydrogenase [Sphaerotilus hippei]
MTPPVPALESLRSAFRGRLLTDAADTAAFLTDWRGLWTGQALAVAQPDRAEDVAAVVRWCHEHRVPIVPQGGNTGLSGGSVPDRSGRALLLSLSRLNRVRGLDLANATIEVEAGCTLAQVQEAARAAGRLFPLSLAAEGSCTIGGNLATNAGGVQVLRYGNARELCLGLEVVTAQGERWRGLRGLRKDNTGYDLRDLYIGSEGTLGVITAAVLKLFPLPAGQAVALVAVPDPAVALQLLQRAQDRLAARLTAFELMSHTCLGLVLRHVPTARLPLQAPSPWYVLLEVSDGESESSARAGLEALLEAAMEADLVQDAALSSSLAQFEALWGLREHISESQGAEGKTIKHDLSLPLSRVPDFIAHADAAMATHFPQVRLVVFGHLGDGNLHYNVSPAPGPRTPDQVAAFLALEGPVNQLVHDAVIAHGGSISAEHGLGVLRRDEAARYRDPVEQRLMAAIKVALDPLNLMNPGKLLP